jgi:hypothetical protein
MGEDDLLSLLGGRFKYKDGKLYNRYAYTSRVKAGEEAGAFSGGYRIVGVNGKRYKAHRVVWMLHRGYIGEGLQIDHIDGDRSNNHIDNLRVCTNAENSRNGKLRVSNTSGIKGVTWSKARSGWQVQIKKDYKNHYFGTYQSLELAELIAQEARDSLHGEYSRHD